MSKTMTDIYRIEIHDVAKADSVEEAFANFKSRINRKETIVYIEHVDSGEKYFIDLQTGEGLSMKCCPAPATTKE